MFEGGTFSPGQCAVLEKLDGHAAGVRRRVVLSFWITIGKTNNRIVCLSRLKHPDSQIRGQVRNNLQFASQAAVSLAMHVPGGEARAGRQVGKNAPQAFQSQALAPGQTHAPTLEIRVVLAPVPSELCRLLDRVPDDLLDASDRILLLRFIDGVLELGVDIVVFVER